MLRKWNELEIPLKIADLNKITTNKEHPGYHLKKYRINNNLYLSKIAKEINININTLENVELGLNCLGREISEKLAKYFKLDTKYFYDHYLEETDDIDKKLKLYMRGKNISLKQLSNEINMDVRALKSWINNERKPSRESYRTLKELHII